MLPNFFPLIKSQPITTQSQLLMTLRKGAFENIVGKGEMLVTSIFSFPKLFSTLPKTNLNFVISKYFQFGLV